MEYEPYNYMAYIPVTVVNGPVINKVVVCHRCFNATDYRFGEMGWTRTVGDPWPSVKKAIYLMRDIQTQVADAAGCSILKNAQDHLWKQGPVA